MSVFRDTTGPLIDEAERRLAELRAERQQAEQRYQLACVSLEKRVAEPAPALPATPQPAQKLLSPRRIAGWAALFAAITTLIATMLL